MVRLSRKSFTCVTVGRIGHWKCPFRSVHSANILNPQLLHIRGPSGNPTYANIYCELGEMNMEEGKLCEYLCQATWLVRLDRLRTKRSWWFVKLVGYKSTNTNSGFQAIQKRPWFSAMWSSFRTYDQNARKCGTCVDNDQWRSSLDYAGIRTKLLQSQMSVFLEF